MPRRSSPNLDAYQHKRDPQRTPEPFGRLYIPATNQLYVVQQHAASHLHFDLRLELDGVLKSWAVPKGPSRNPEDKRLAVQTEDHPLDYADFEGEIPPGNYGAGFVAVWDRGRYEALEPLHAGFEKGKLLFELHGHKLQGRWTLVRLKSAGSTGKEWLLIKEQDSYADSAMLPDTSVLSGLTTRQLQKPAQARRRLQRAAGRLPGAVSAGPALYKAAPMLAGSGDAHNRKGWVWELKYDGYRVLAKKQADQVSLITRNGHPIGERFPEICQVLAHLPVADCVIDGELVVNDAHGRPSFSLLQQRARSMSAHEVAASAITQPASYYCFDLLGLAASDLRACSLLQRKRLLRQLIPAHSAYIYSEDVAEQGLRTLAAAHELGIEGVVGKRVDAAYVSGRSGDWIKVRRHRHGDYVVAGWSPGRNNAADIGALALAEYRSGELVYVGHAGSGLSSTLRRELQQRCKRLRRKTSPLAAAVSSNRVIHWLRPQLVVEVKYAEYTAQGHLRQPSIQRLRDDKDAHECVGYADTTAPAPAPAAAARRVVVTNPEKIFFPAPGFSKKHLVDYYRSIAPWMLPYLLDRPIVLTRYPDGVTGKSFYQRDVPDYVPDWIRRAVLWSESTDKPVNYFVLSSEDDLAYIANMGTLPIHMWHSTLQSLDKADWCVLDLDPKSAPFKDVITLAKAIGALADEVDLPAYVKTSGASGLHVLLPLHRQLDHDQSRTLGELLARVIVERYPDIATVTRTVRARKRKVYVDFMQNGHGRLIVAPYAVRAETAGSVSMPLHWRELRGGLANHKYHLGNALRRVKKGPDPMAGVLTDQPDLARALARLAELMRG